mgnify:CR=1 FL=1
MRELGDDVTDRRTDRQTQPFIVKDCVLIKKIFSLEMFWKEKYSALAEENTSLNDLIRVLEQVKFNVLCQKNLIKDVTTPSPGSQGALL